MHSQIRNAAAPVIGGVSWALVEEITSTAPARSGVKSVCLIKGLVVATLAIVEPKQSPEAAEAAFAGPLRKVAQ